MGTCRPMAAVALLASTFAATSRTVNAQSPRTVSVLATDYKFDAPASIPAGTVSFRLQNSRKEVHHLWLVQLKGGKTFEDFMKAMESSNTTRMPKWAVDVGGPNEASPGVQAEATITLEPGRYAMVCYVPSPDGRPHVMKGMVKAFTVTSTGATAANEPKVDVTVRMTDYAFELSKPITAGARVIRIENVAAQATRSSSVACFPASRCVRRSTGSTMVRRAWRPCRRSGARAVSPKAVIKSSRPRSSPAITSFSASFPMRRTASRTLTTGWRRNSSSADPTPRSNMRS